MVPQVFYRFERAGLQPGFFVPEIQAALTELSSSERLSRT
jgi:hypothetical protein